jgi:hypothetical protein
MNPHRPARRHPEELLVSSLESKEALYHEALAGLVNDFGGLITMAASGAGSFEARLVWLTEGLVHSLGARPEAARLLLREFVDAGVALRASGGAAKAAIEKLRRLPERISRQGAKEDAKSAKGIRDILGALGVFLGALARNAFWQTPRARRNRSTSAISRPPSSARSCSAAPSGRKTRSRSARAPSWSRRDASWASLGPRRARSDARASSLRRPRKTEPPKRRPTRKA